MRADFLIKSVKIFALYLEYLGRLPDFQGFNEFMLCDDDLDEVRGRIISSDEFRRIDLACDRVRALLAPHEGKRKILLFGAFGNGNLGDREMARVVAQRLERDGDTVCFAYSQLTFADYDFVPERKLDPSLLPLLPRVLAQFDGLVIGGGGLLYYSHEPLWDPAWSGTIPIPYAVLATGVGSPLDRRLSGLVAGATVASSRDRPGLVELQRYNGQALLCHDPILSFRPLLAPRHLHDDTAVIRRLFVLRAPLQDWHAEVKRQLLPTDLVAIFEPHVDHPIMYFFGDVVVLSTIDQFDKLVADVDLVVTDRYHAAILALLRGCPVIGLCNREHASKQAIFFNEIGLSNHCYSVNHLPSEFTPYDMAEVSNRLKEIQGIVDINYNKLLNVLYAEIDRRNLSKATSKEMPDFENGGVSLARVEASLRSRAGGPAQNERLSHLRETFVDEGRGQQGEALDELQHLHTLRKQLNQAQAALAAKESALDESMHRETSLVARLEAMHGEIEELSNKIEAENSRFVELSGMLAHERSLSLLLRNKVSTMREG